MASLLANLLGLSSSLYSIQVFNRYIGYGLDGTLVALTTGALLALAAEFYLKTVRTRLLRGVLDPQDAADNQRLMQHLLRVKTDVMTAQAPQYSYQTLRQLQQVQQAYSVTNWLAFIDVPFALIYLVAIYSLLPLLGVVVCAAAAMTIAVSWWWHQQACRQQQQLQQVQMHYDASLARTAAPATITAFNAAPLITEQHKAPLIAWVQQRSNSLAQQLAVQHSTQWVSGLTSVAVICLGAIAVTQGNMDMGSLIGANILAARAIAMINQAAKANQQLDQAQQALTAVGEANSLATEPDTGAKLSDYRGQIALRGISHSYDARLAPFINQLSLAVAGADSLVICGNNGAGKTTIAKILLGLLTPNQGQVLVDGVDLRQLQLSWWRQQVAYVPQEPVFVNGSLHDNLVTLVDTTQLAADAMQQRLSHWLNYMGLQAWVDRHPDGLEQAITSGGAQLPIGIRKRLALVRALMGQAQLIVFDEVHEGLDAAGRAMYAKLLKELQQQGKTLIITSSDAQIFAGNFNCFDLNSGQFTAVHVKPASPVLNRSAESLP